MQSTRGSEIAWFFEGMLYLGLSVVSENPLSFAYGLNEIYVRSVLLRELFIEKQKI